MSDLVTMFTGSDGVATRQYNEVKEFIHSNGIVSKARNTLNDELKEISVKKVEHDLKLEQRRIFLTLKFASLDTLLGQLQATGDFISEQFSSTVEPLAFKK